MVISITLVFLKLGTASVGVYRCRIRQSVASFAGAFSTYHGGFPVSQYTGISIIGITTACFSDIDRGNSTENGLVLQLQRPSDL